MTILCASPNRRIFGVLSSGYYDYRLILIHTLQYCSSIFRSYLDMLSLSTIRYLENEWYIQKQILLFIFFSQPRC